jgi:hypothetical protein
MNRFREFFVGAMTLSCLGLLLCACKPATPNLQKPKPDVSFKPQEMADALHGVIAADREVYAIGIVEKFKDRLEELGIAPHVLRPASQKVQQPGAEFHYVARSFWPISPGGRAETDVEERGLRFVAEQRGSNFYAEEYLGGRRYFTAVYADVAVVPSCAECHNKHKDSPRRDFKTGDVIGGIIVRVPLEF